MASIPKNYWLYGALILLSVVNILLFRYLTMLFFIFLFFIFIIPFSIVFLATRIILTELPLPPLLTLTKNLKKDINDLKLPMELLELENNVVKKGNITRRSARCEHGKPHKSLWVVGTTLCNGSINYQKRIDDIYEDIKNNIKYKILYLSKNVKNQENDDWISDFCNENWELVKMIRKLSEEKSNDYIHLFEIKILPIPLFQMTVDIFDADVNSSAKGNGQVRRKIHIHFPYMNEFEDYRFDKGIKSDDNEVVEHYIRQFRNLWFDNKYGATKIEFDKLVEYQKEKEKM